MTRFDSLLPQKAKYFSTSHETEIVMRDGGDEIGNVFELHRYLVFDDIRWSLDFSRISFFISKGFIIMIAGIHMRV